MTARLFILLTSAITLASGCQVSYDLDAIDLPEEGGSEVGVDLDGVVGPSCQLHPLLPTVGVVDSPSGVDNAFAMFAELVPGLNTGINAVLNTTVRVRNNFDGTALVTFVTRIPNQDNDVRVETMDLNGNTVSGTLSELPIVLGANSTNPETSVLFLSDVQIEFKVNGGNLSNGLAVGRVLPEALETPIPGTQIFIEILADIRGDGIVDPDSACDSLSFGFEFNGSI